MEPTQIIVKDKVLSKVEEMMECAVNIGRTDCFEISIKHVNGEIISSMKFCDQEE